MDDATAFRLFHTMSSQISFVCIFLAGFSAAILGSFVSQRENSNLSKAIIISLLVATCTLLVSLFILTDIFIHTTEGYPTNKTKEDLQGQFGQSMVALMFGLTSFLTFISLSGWLSSRRMGIFTTIMGIATFIALLVVMS